MCGHVLEATGSDALHVNIIHCFWSFSPLMNLHIFVTEPVNLSADHITTCLFASLDSTSLKRFAHVENGKVQYPF